MNVPLTTTTQGPATAQPALRRHAPLSAIDLRESDTAWYVDRLSDTAEQPVTLAVGAGRTNERTHIAAVG